MDNKSSSKAHSKGCGCGIGSFGIGSILAAILSYSTWHSIFWAIIHFFFGWVYIIYFAIVHTAHLQLFWDNLVRLVTGG
ncbi:MAG: hypothetical protein LBV19_09740 [Streptococcaceae bacterium]|nr:hypothetical protein [Streptococcaceae bacterium]